MNKDWILNTLDCGSDSCKYAGNRGGMRHTGSCSCFDELSTKKRIYVDKLFYMVITLSKEVENLKREMGILYTCIGQK